MTSLPRAVNDLRGRRFNRLRVPRNAEPEIRNRHAYWPCVCQCPKKTRLSVRGTSLVKGRIVSCGCWRADHDVRQGARMRVPVKRRIEIAAAGGAAYATLYKGKPRAVSPEVE